jgi:hypothetical protein
MVSVLVLNYYKTLHHCRGSVISEPDSNTTQLAVLTNLLKKHPR